jgi:ABC-type glycerol-3-phosphate transport system substrate-binding protein
MVMNANSPDKNTTWEFMEWATGKSLLLRSAFEGNMNPTRASVWEDSRFQERAAAWGDFAGVARQLAENVSDVLVTPAVNYIDIARRWTGALRDAYGGADSLEGCLTKAASEIEALVAR